MEILLNNIYTLSLIAILAISLVMVFICMVKKEVEVGFGFMILVFSILFPLFAVTALFKLSYKLFQLSIFSETLSNYIFSVIFIFIMIAIGNKFKIFSPVAILKRTLIMVIKNFKFCKKIKKIVNNEKKETKIFKLYFFFILAYKETVDYWSPGGCKYVKGRDKTVIGKYIIYWKD